MSEINNEIEKILNMVSNKDISYQDGAKMIEEIKHNFVHNQDKKNKHSECLYNNVCNYLIDLFIAELKILPEDINPMVSFELLGVDSISITSLASVLEKKFKDLPKTIFFEYRNIDELANYFIDNYYDEIAKEVSYIEEDSTEMKNISSKSIKNVPIEKSNSKDIAIIGLAGKYPGAEDLNGFWRNLKLGKDCIKEVPKERWNYKDYYDKNIGTELKTYSKWGGFIENADEFDPLFFKIAPKQASLIDPQERIFLEKSWECMEDAGYTQNNLEKKKVGVYAGVMWGQYQMCECLIDGKKQVPKTTFSSIANRVSYFLNLNGPSMAIDTMCSSSLTAIHLACNAIHNDEIDMAFAGGVNIMVHPSKYIQLSQGHFLSTDGRCRSFGEGGDGYVPGEGVGIVLLKSYEKALKDKDNIYGVIKSSTLNHGGRSNGYTVPNVNSQANLIKEGIKKSNIDINDISYIEAHGTGTSLGDPIEFRALLKAFEEKGNQSKKCAIGSVKSNIGHAESASGIAGVTKILLQFINKELVPSIHADNINPNINFENSKFYLQRKNENWNIEDGKKRIAGINSFGAGGANANIILEEYVNRDDETLKEISEKKILVLSAKEKNQLLNVVSNLKKFIENNREGKDEKKFLNDIIYTLQVGREAFEYRISTVVTSLDEIIEKLNKIESEQQAEGIFFGYTSENDIELRKTNLIDCSELLHNENDKYDEFSKKWAEGNAINWSSYYVDVKYHRISLPTYPFEKNKYFAYIPKSQNTAEEKNNKQIFDYEISINDRFIKEHIIDDKCILPGVAYLEIALEAIKNVTDMNVEINDVAFLNTFVLDRKSKKIYVELNENQGGYDFRIFENEDCIFAEGKVTISEENNKCRNFDISKIVSECTGRNEAKALYDQYEKLGYNYGEYFRCSGDVFYNENSAYTVIKKNNGDEFILDPGVMDTCVRTALSIQGGLFDENSALRIPFCLNNFKLYGSLKDLKYAYAYTDDSNNLNDDKTKSCNISLLDEKGYEIASFKQFISRILTTEKYKVVYMKNSFEEKNTIDVVSKRNILVCDINENIYSEFAEKYKDDNFIYVSLKNEFKEIDFNKYEVKVDKKEDYKKLFNLLKNKNIEITDIVLSQMLSKEEIVNIDSLDISGNYSDKLASDYKYSAFAITSLLNGINDVYQDKKLNILYYVNSKSKNAPHVTAISSYFKAYMVINHMIRFSTVMIENNEDIQENIINEICYLDKTSNNIISYNDNKRFALQLKERNMENIDKSKILKNGVYIFAGGMGKLGLMFASYMIQEYNAKIIVVGRRERNNEISEKLKSIGNNIDYFSADVCMYESVEKLIKSVKEKYSCINGIVNFSGKTSGKSILDTNNENILSVLEPKVNGTINLDLCTINEDLDFFLTFSSISSVVGDFGECCYSMANEFENQYMNMRGKLKAEGKRKGKSISIAWPLWKDGAFALQKEQETLYFNYSGMKAIGRDEGIEIFEKCLGNESGCYFVAYGDENKIKMRLGLVSSEDSLKEENVAVSEEKQLDNTECIAKMKEYFKNIISNEIGVPFDRINCSQSFDRYGIDSLMIMNMNKVIEKDFKDIPKTLFFECNSINELVEYFIKKKLKDVEEHLGINFNKEVNNDTIAVRKKIVHSENLQVRKDQNNNENLSEDDRIAIIGVAGKYPMADNIDEFWEVLSSGKDCISEIPLERWDYKKYYNPEKGVKGKTYCKWGGFISDADKFDALFFNISPYQAEHMDPQERIFLESAWNAIEDAGYTKKSLKNENVGVFVGAMYAHYQMVGEDEYQNNNLVAVSSYLSSIANRVSYFMNFSGPSVTLDTACSSSLEAIRQGCLNIKNGDCDMALVGGVNLSLHPQKYIFLCQSNFLASDGRCRSYGDGGDGYVPGEGVGAILLKPLKRAIEDNDNIYGVINSIAANHGGRTSGFTVPSPKAQANVIRNALNKGRIDPRTVSYIEGHGTGTALGDPIEVSGLNQVFSEFTNEVGYCALGSAKSNIGHLESAAGIAGVTKILLQMKYKKIPPVLHSDKINPNIDFVKSPFYVEQKLEDWKETLIKKNGVTQKYPRRAGINAFGAGGANVHVQLEEYFHKEDSIDSLCNGQSIIVLSAKSSERVRIYAKSLYDYLEKLTAFKPSDNRDDLNAFVKESLLDIFSKLSQIPEKEIVFDENFDEYEIDIYMLNKFYKTIAERYNVIINVQDMYNETSLQSIMEYLINNYRNELEKYYNISKVYTNTAVSKINRIAYTLQVGREEMEYRIATVVKDEYDLLEKLKDFIEGKDNVFYKGQASNDNNDVLLFDDEDGEDIIELLLKKKRYDKLAMLWTRGNIIDWDKLYNTRKQRKISLPTYPFDKKRYYLNKTENNEEIKIEEVAIEEAKVNTEEVSNEEDLLYTTVWEEVELKREGTLKEKENILLCYSTKSARLIEAFEEVHKDDKIVKKIINKNNELLISEPLSKFDKVYYIGGISSEKKDYSKNDYMYNIKPLFNLMKFVYNKNCPKEIIVVSNNAYKITKDEFINSYAGGLFALTKNLEKEYKNIKFKFIDIDSVDKYGMFRIDYVKNLLSNINNSIFNDNVKEFAFRNNKLYLKKIIKLKASENGNKNLKANGIYIVFGGMGNIGNDLSKYLLNNYHANVVVVGRSELNEKLKSKIYSIENNNGEISYYQADVLNAESVEKLIANIKKKYNKINGVFNSTMVFEEQKISEMKMLDFENVILTKIMGNTNIFNAVKDEDLDFYVSFSSVQAFTGNIGRAHYSTACSFADEYLLQKADENKVPIRIINWGFWCNHGGGRLDKDYIKMLNESGIDVIEVDEGMIIIEKAIAGEVVQTLVLKVNKYILDLMEVKLNHIGNNPVYDTIFNYVKENKIYDDENDKKELVTLCASITLDVFQRMNVFNKSSEEYNILFLKEKLNVEDKYFNFYMSMLKILGRANFININDDIIKVNSAIESKEVLDDLKNIQNSIDNLNKCSSYSGYLPLLNVCAKNIPDIITGKKTSMEVIFPKSSMKLVEKVYKGNSKVDYLNEVLAVGIEAQVKEEIKKLAPNEKVTIIEVGSGTGSTSEVVLKRIKKYEKYVKYIFTDISKIFLINGKERFKKDYPFVEYKLLNIENNIEEQGYKKHSASVVFGTNVFHATKNIINTLEKTKELLMNNGLLILNEGIENIDVLTLTFGLLDGWWLFEDKQIRIENSPLLTQNKWIEVMKKCGFEKIILCENVMLFSNNVNDEFEAYDNHSNDEDIYEKSTNTEKLEKRSHSESERAIIDTIIAELKLEEEDIELDKSFMEYGMDSILAIKIVNGINEKLNLNITVDDIFQYDTIEELTKEIEKK